MTQIPWLEDDQDFPPHSQALSSPNGLLAAGGDLGSARLIRAYRSGIFPWFEDDQPLLWWSPDPRAIIRPADLKISRSLRKRLKRAEFTVYLNRDFPAVVEACSAPRSYTNGTWITQEMIDAYCELHVLGHAHSFECYAGDSLVGGLYGISVQNLFCGESMFHSATDASKFAFAHLARFMQSHSSPIIDCQLENDHLLSLGCEMIRRDDYLEILNASLSQPPIDWSPRQLVYDWHTPQPETGQTEP